MIVRFMMMCVCVFSCFCFDCFPGEFAGCVTLSGDRFQPIFFLGKVFRRRCEWLIHVFCWLETEQT